MRAAFRRLLVGRCAFAVPLSLIACTLGCGEERARHVGHGVLLIAIDGLRADHVGTLGYDRDTTPHLDALAARGTLFESAISASPLWLPSMATLLTGCDPNMARRQLPGLAPVSLAQNWFVPPSLPNVAVEFAVAGHRTAAFVDTPEFGAHSGLVRGFHDVRFESNAAERRERGPFDLAAEWIRSRPIGEDWFCLVHTSDLLRAFDDPHPEWDGFFEPRAELEWVPPVGAGTRNFHSLPSGRWEGGTVQMGRYEARYDGALRRLDAALQRLFDGLELGGRFKRTTVCVVGTHGFQFGEAGLMLDHGLFSPMDVHVPLVVRPAVGLENVSEVGRRRREVVSSMDVAPTLLELAGVVVPQHMHGESLMPRLFGSVPVDAYDRIVTVSCGLVLGVAAYSDELMVEELFPGFESSSQLLDQWLGGSAISGIERRAYQWRDVRRDVLTRGSDVPPELAADAHRLSARLATWFEEFVLPEHMRVWGVR